MGARGPFRGMFFFLPNLAGDPFKLRESHPGIFHLAYPEGSPPVESKIDYTTLQTIRARLPARRTHKSMAVPVRYHGAIHASAGTLTNGDAATCDLPGFQILQPQQQLQEAPAPPPTWRSAEVDAPSSSYRPGPQTLQPPRPPIRDAPRQQQQGEVRPPASGSMLALEDAPHTMDDMQARPAVNNITTRMAHVTKALFAPEPPQRRPKKKGGKQQGDGSYDDESCDGSETSEDPPPKRSRKPSATRSMKATPLKEPRHTKDVRKVHTKAAKTSPPKALKTAPTKAMKTGPGECVLAFPGVPKRPILPMEYKNWRIYSDVNQQVWRCKRVGERHDKSCSWKSDPKAAWARVNGIITGRAP